MAFDALTAAQAYAQAVKRSEDGAPAVPSEESGPDFAAMLAEAAGGAQRALGEAEQVAQSAARGEAELVEVVTAITAAEATLETVVAVRDQVVRAYQEIMRMPV